MEIQVVYADWHVGDGDPPIHVGQPWDVTIEVKPAEGATPDDWYPRLRPSHEEATGLWLAEGEPAQHRLVGDVVKLREHEFGGPWVGIEAGDWRLAAPGRHAGRVQGDVVLQHDTYMIDDEYLRTYANQQVQVEDIAHVTGRYRQVPRRRGEFEHIGWEPPRPVTNTHEMSRSPSARPGQFVLTCRLLDRP
jgi:hypothetical protein